MRRTARRFVVVLIVALALFGMFASSALAALEDTPTPTLGTSMTNPGWGADYWWRKDWGNTLYPEFTLNPPGVWEEDVDGYMVGMLYAVDRSAGTVIDGYGNPGGYYRANWTTGLSKTGGTHLDHTLDMLGIYQNPPAGGWPAQAPNQHSPLEGAWAMHYRFFSNFRYAANQWSIPFGIDLTPPKAVTGIKVTTGLTTSAVTTWTPATRAHVTWNPGDLPGQYDELSGIGYYQVLVDDKLFVPETSETPVQGRVYGSDTFVIAPTFDIESMPPGAHKVSVVTVDRATNKGPAANYWFYSDPDTPTISFTSPATSILSMKTVFSVDASDAAGPPVVTMALDGSGLTTITAPPYSYKPDLSHLGSGVHTLTAKATDHLGRTVTISKTVSFSNTTTSSGFMTAGPSEFVYLEPVSSTSNPAGDRWRWDPLDHTKIWTNDLHPDFALTPGSELAQLQADSGGSVAGMLYDVRRAPELIDAGKPDTYFRSWRPLVGEWSTHLDATLDLPSVMEYPPSGGWPTMEPGAEQAVEGTWYLQYKGFLNSGWAESATNVVKFGVDVTPPSTVDSLTASPTTDTAMAGAVSAGTRTHVTWRTKDYDGLSGVAYYQLLLDGVKVIPDEGDAQGRVFDFPGRAEPAATIENITPGKHKIEVYAVDRAGNEGKSVSTDVYSDPDVPTISIAKPTATIIGMRPTVAATVADVGGVRSVVFKLDGVVISNQTSAPYSDGCDLAAFASGGHTLTATVTDMYGRSVTATKTVSLDKTPPPALSSLKATVSKRTVTLSVRTSKACTIRFAYNVTASASKASHVDKRVTKPGTYTIKFTVPRPAAKTGIFWLGAKVPYAAQAVDSMGNVSNLVQGKVTVKFYKLVKTGKNKVKVVAY